MAVGELEGRTSRCVRARIEGRGYRELISESTFRLQTSISSPVSSSSSPMSVSTLSCMSPSAFVVLRNAESAAEWKVLAWGTPWKRKDLRRDGGWSV